MVTFNTNFNNLPFDMVITYEDAMIENNNQFLLSTIASEESNTVDVLIYADLQYLVQSASTNTADFLYLTCKTVFQLFEL